MRRLRITAARLVVLHAIVVITNPAAAVCRMLVPVVQNNAQEEFRRRVPVAYGRAVQNVRQIRFAAVEFVVRVVQISTCMAIHAKITALQTAERMEIPALKPMQRRHAQAAHVFIHAKPTIATFPVHV